jgi:hypothetical protein
MMAQVNVSAGADEGRDNRSVHVLPQVQMEAQERRHGED